MSQPSTDATHLYAQYVITDVKEPPPAPQDFWKTVLEEEPLVGEHWQDPWADEGDDAKSLSSHPSMDLESRESLSSTRSTSDEVRPLLEDEEPEDEQEQDEIENPFSYADPTKQHTLNDAHDLYETLCANQYWRTQYVNDAARRAGKMFDMNDPATLGEFSKL